MISMFPDVIEVIIPRPDPTCAVEMTDSVLSAVTRLSPGLSPSSVSERADELRSVLGSAAPSSVQTETLKLLASQAEHPGQFAR